MVKNSEFILAKVLNVKIDFKNKIWYNNINITIVLYIR